MLLGLLVRVLALLSSVRVLEGLSERVRVLELMLPLVLVLPDVVVGPPTISIISVLVNPRHRINAYQLRKLRLDDLTQAVHPRGRFAGHKSTSPQGIHY